VHRVQGRNWEGGGKGEVEHRGRFKFQQFLMHIFTFWRIGDQTRPVVRGLVGAKHFLESHDRTARTLTIPRIEAAYFAIRARMVTHMMVTVQRGGMGGIGKRGV